MALANTGERFGYYTMLAVFTLFLQANFGFDEKLTSTIFSSFLMFVYFLPLFGGALADKVGYSKLVTTGSRELATVKVRYKEPLEDRSHELAKVIGSAKAGHTDDLRLAYIVYVCAEKLRGSDKISDEEIELAKRLYQELGDQARERNSADLYKLAGILDKSEKELGIGIQEDDPFEW